MSRKRILTGTAVMGFDKLIVMAVQFLSVPVLAHSWGLALYGQWLMLAAVPMFISASDFGFAGVASNRLIGEVARGDTDAALKTMQSGLGIVLVLTSALLALVLSVIFMLPARVFEVAGGMAAADARLVLAMLCVGGIVTAHRGLFIGVSRSMHHFATAALLNAIVMLVEGLVIMGTALSGGSLFYAALGFLTVRVVGTLSQVILARRHAGWMKLGLAHADRQEVRRMMRPSLAAMLYPLSNAGFLQGTAIAVGAAGGASLVPVYTALRTLARMGLQLLQTISLPVMPEYTAAEARGEVAEAKRFAGMLATLSIVGGMVYAAGLALLGAPFIDFWTNGAISPPPAAILIFATSVALGAVWPQLANLLIAINRHESFSYFYAGIAALGVGLTYALVRLFGVTGGATSYFAVDASMTLLILWLMHRQGRLPPIGLAPVLAVLGNKTSRS